ncbi:MAG: Uma2 family endonuclease, partial [Longimicrobiales bacterium]
GAETGFVLRQDPPTVRAPDAAFVATARIPPPAGQLGFAALAPDLVVEIVSPSNWASELQARVLDYLEAGTRLVWVIDPASRTATVYRSRTDIEILSDDAALDGADVLPGLRLPLVELFDD